MLTNGPGPAPLPGPQCFFAGGRDRANRPCRGNLHEYTVQMFKKLDGTPMLDAPKETTHICEEHYPDRHDPKFLMCSCRLCKDRKVGAN